MMDGSRDTARDEKLWAVAEVRARFKRHLFSYPVLIGILWLINYLTDSAPLASVNWWAVWPTLGLLVAALLEAVSTYTGLTTSFMVDREYERLKRRHDH